MLAPIRSCSRAHARCQHWLATESGEQTASRMRTMYREVQTVLVEPVALRAGMRDERLEDVEARHRVSWGTAHLRPLLVDTI